MWHAKKALISGRVINPLGAERRIAALLILSTGTTWARFVSVWTRGYIVDTVLRVEYF